MMNIHLDAVVLLLEQMTLTEAEAQCVHSAIQITGSPSVVPATVASSHRTTAPPVSVVAPLAGRDTFASDDKETPAVPPEVTLAILNDLPTTTVVIDGQKRYQKTYEGQTFDIPRNDATGPFYLVTRGRRIGVFSTLQRTNPHVQGVKLASFVRANSLDAALLGMADAIMHKEVETLR